ncbi:MAG: ABC transporter permease subunit [Candidatus Latescibacterota bacterium]
MLFTLIRREITGHVLSLRFIVTFVLFFSLVLVSVLVMTHGYRGRVKGYEASSAAHGAALDEIAKVQDPDQRANDLFANKGIYGDVRPQRLGVFVSGLEPSLPSQVHASVFNPRSVDEDLYRNPLLSLFTSPDYGHIVNIVVSLLALLFVFDAICGEKERGTLKLTLSNPVPRDLLILGKWIGGYLALAVPFLVAVLAGFAYMRLAGDVVLEGEDTARFLWIVGVSLLYVSLFFTLGLMISALTRRPATSLIVSLFVWIAWILVIPNLAPVVARLAYAVPSPEKIAAEKQAVDQETELRLQRVSQTTLSYGKEGQKMQEEIRAEGESRKDKLDRFYEDEFRTQIGVSQTLSRLSPAASFRYVTTELSQTGVSRYQEVKKASKRFREELTQLNDDLNSRRQPPQYRLPPDWFHQEQVPSLRVTAARLADSLGAATTDLLLLGIYNVLFFMGTYVFFLRYDAT